MSTGTTWPPPGGGPARAATATRRAGGRRPPAWSVPLPLRGAPPHPEPGPRRMQPLRRSGSGVRGGAPAASPHPMTSPPDSSPPSHFPSGWRRPGARGPSSWPPGPGRTSATARGCAARPGWPSPSPTGPRTPPPRGSGWPRPSTRTPPWPPRPTCARTQTRCTGRTATWSPGPRSGSGRSSWPRVPCVPPTRRSSGPRCSTGCAPRASACCAGPRTRGRCGPASASCTARSAAPGRTWPTTPCCWSGRTTGWSRSCPGRGGARTSPGSTPARP